MLTNGLDDDDPPVLLGSSSEGEGAPRLVPESSDSEVEEIKMLQETQNGIACITKEEISRLEILRVKCDEYYKWCEKVSESYIESDKRVPLEVLTNLAQECEVYPSSKFHCIWCVLIFQRTSYISFTQTPKL